MFVLHVPLHSLGTKLASIEGKFFPRLESDNFVIADSELDSTLLPAEAAMSLNQLVVFSCVGPSPGRNPMNMRTELSYQFRYLDWQLCHDYFIPCIGLVVAFHNPSWVSARFLRRQFGHTSW